MIGNIVIQVASLALLASATAPSLAYVSSPGPAALPLCRGLHKVHCTPPFRMAYANYKVDKQTIHIKRQSSIAMALAMHLV